MKIRFYILFTLLWISPIAFSCAEELNPDILIDDPEQYYQEVQSFTMSIIAGRVVDEGEYTKALNIDNSGKITTLWVEGESVTVYNETKQNELSGTLTALSSGKSTTLRGTLTGVVSKGDVLTLKFLSPNYHFQDGTLTGNDTSIDKVCDYSTAQVTVTDVNGSVITTSGVANFVNKQAIVKFSLRNEDNTSNVSARSLLIKVDDEAYKIQPSAPVSEFYVAIPAFSSKTLTIFGENDSVAHFFVKKDASLESGKYYTIAVRMSSQTVMEYIMGNIRKNNVYSPSNSVIADYVESMGEDGKWPDINYDDKANTWEPQLHYNRLLLMSYAYISPQSLYYKKLELFEKIVLGIQSWLSMTPKSSNWYHNQIDEPSNFGLLLIAMRDGEMRISGELESQLFERWKKNGSNPSNRTGSNRSEMALHWLYFGCLMEAVDTLNQALNYIFEPIAYTDEEGLQVDNSFFQHGPQLYIGGYGEVMLESVLQTAVCVQGTSFALSSEQLEILRNFVINSYSSVIRGDAINWNAIGRQISRPGFLTYPERRIPIMEKMRDVDGQYASVYNQILNRLQGTTSASDGITPVHTHFYRGDYTIHVRPEYSIGVRMVSSRTCRQESINGENLLGYYLSDGSTVISCTGKEYTDIMPFWDWTKIPGVTSPVTNMAPEARSSMSVYGTASFSGGVSDTNVGCTAYKYYDDYNGINTGASKGYFFFNDEVVCLGAGVVSSHERVQTTINQCWGDDNFEMGIGGVYNVLSGEINGTYFNDAEWVLHDGIGYYFPEFQRVFVENKTKEGNWRWISTMWPDNSITGKVFTLGLEEHGPLEEGKYSYYIIPKASVSSLLDYKRNKQIEILANTDSVQVVYHNGLKLYECIFYRACTYHGEEDIYSHQPCALLIKKLDNSYIVHIADPSQSKINMLVGIRGKGMTDFVYGSCDYTGIDNQFAGTTNELCLNENANSVSSISLDQILSYSANNRAIIFNKRYKGIYEFVRADGIIAYRENFDSDLITINSSIKGSYVLRVSIDGVGTITRKVIL